MTQTVSEADKQILATTIQNENNIINQRMGWALQLQGFLFAAFFLSPEAVTEKARLALVCLGFVTSLSSLVGSYFGNRALVNSINLFDSLQSAEADDVKVRAGHKFQFAPTWLMPHLFIPFALMVTWGVLAFEQLS